VTLRHHNIGSGNASKRKEGRGTRGTNRRTALANGGRTMNLVQREERKGGRCRVRKEKALKHESHNASTPIREEREEKKGGGEEGEARTPTEETGWTFSSAGEGEKRGKGKRKRGLDERADHSRPAALGRYDWSKREGGEGKKEGKGGHGPFREVSSALHPYLSSSLIVHLGGGGEKGERPNVSRKKYKKRGGKGGEREKRKENTYTYTVEGTNSSCVFSPTPWTCRG